MVDEDSSSLTVGGKDSGRILVADHYPDILHLVSHNLEKEGYGVLPKPFTTAQLHIMLQMLIGKAAT